MEWFNIPKLLRCNHHSSRCLDVSPFLADLDGGKTFREIIGEVELRRNDSFAATVDETTNTKNHSGIFPLTPRQQTTMGTIFKDPIRKFKEASNEVAGQLLFVVENSSLFGLANQTHMRVREHDSFSCASRKVGIDFYFIRNAENMAKYAFAPAA